MGVSCFLSRQLSGHDRLSNHRTWQDGLIISERWKYTNILVRFRRVFITFLRLLTLPISLFVTRGSQGLCTTSTSDGEPLSESRIQSLTFFYSSIPPVPQIVFYQAGVGTDLNPSLALLDG